MPRIFDNIEQRLAPALRHSLGDGLRADLCVGYFNLRGWSEIGEVIDAWPSGAGPCRLLIGMHRPPHEMVRALHGMTPDRDIDLARVAILRRQITDDFRAQLVVGIPTRAHEQTLRVLAAQLRSGRVRVRLHLRSALHAKLYLVHKANPDSPVVAYLGSSNLTFSGLTHQGELNVDVVDHDAGQKLSRWFEDRWGDRFSVDISEDLARVIDESWAGERLLPPFHVYVKIAWHLSREARAGLSEFRIPPDLDRDLFDFQKAAVKIAAHHVNTRGGVMLGDVVGLGKTMMATALAAVLEELGYDTLIICPKNLASMWESYRDRYGLRARVLPLSQVQSVLPGLRRYRLVVIDESHNLRNREGKRYRVLADYIRTNESRCVLLTATPYNKTYLDLGSQLRLFVPEDKDLGIRPEKLIRELGEAEFLREHQCPVRSLAAFEKSPHVDDWRELMRLFLVRRTRSFIRKHYAKTDVASQRRYLTFPDGTRAFFPDRVPRTLRFTLDERSADDSYSRLYSDGVVQALTGLTLPRYGLGNYVRADAARAASADERKLLDGLSKSGRRLQGFCLTNLFKRLESSGAAFLKSVERHVLRNHVFLHALKHGQEIPIGPQESALLDDAQEDLDPDTLLLFEDTDEESADTIDPASEAPGGDDREMRARARRVYDAYRSAYVKRFRWLRAELWKPALATALRRDCETLGRILREAGEWDPQKDEKLSTLTRLLRDEHPRDKVLVFSQFADTVEYVAGELERRGVASVGCVTGATDEPTALAHRFSPTSNGLRDLPADQELRVLVATDLLSEGQNLQDAAIVVSYDLPWAVIRLVQRAGRVDRIGQRAETILCYSFLPSEGVERLIRLRARMRQRLLENAEVVGTDEAFFDDEGAREVVDLYNEKAGILDGSDDGDVDLASHALQIWKDSIAADPSLERLIPALPDVVYATRAARPEDSRPPGVLVYVRTAQDADALILLDEEGRSVTESQFEILRLAACRADTPALEARPDHHALVGKGVEHVLDEEVTTGGQLGRPGSVRARVYERLMRLAGKVRGTLFDNPALHRAVDEIYQHPLRAAATDALHRHLRAKVDDDRLAELVLSLREDGRLCNLPAEGEATAREATIVCSMGIR